MIKLNNNKLIIGIDHGYGNIKTASHCFKTGITASDVEPSFAENVLHIGDKYYQIGEGHKEFKGDKITDNDFYLLTFAAVAMELQDMKITSGSIVISAGLPLTWSAQQKESFRDYLLKEHEISFDFNKTTYHLVVSQVLITNEKTSRIGAENAFDSAFLLGCLR